MRASVLALLTYLSVLIFVLPFLWALSLSMRPSLDLYAPSGWGIPWLDFPPKLEAWPLALAYPGLAQATGNSLGISAAATLLSLVLGLLDTALVLVVVNATVVFPLVVVLLRQAMAEVPSELAEAAGIDGAGHLRVLVAIVLPLAAPAMVAAGLIVFAFVWNDFLFAFSLSTLHVRTLPVLAVGGWAGGVRQSAVGMLICMSVPLIAALLAQRWLVSSLTLGAVKG